MTATEYLSQELSVKIGTIEDNPYATITVREATHFLKSFSSQEITEFKAKLKNDITWLIKNDSLVSVETCRRIEKLIDSIQ